MGDKIRQERDEIFDREILEAYNNRLHWEMLCACDKPLVPFFGAGMSAWCYPTWRSLLLEIGSSVYGEDITKNVIKEALDNEESDITMDEIAECIFNYKDIENKSDSSNELHRNLLLNVGKKDRYYKKKAMKELYHKFSADVRIRKTRPFYQNLFSRLFSNVLITTNYDKLLEDCYGSILSYSYSDLNRIVPKDKGYSDASWLFKAVSEKLKKAYALSKGERYWEEVTVPDTPMLLKVHGNLERLDSAALTTEGYDKAYQGELPLLLEKVFTQGTVVFMGCSLVDDRIMGILKKVKEVHKDLMHFAFLPSNEAENIRDLEQYGIYPIIFPSLKGYDFCYGLLLENLYRRKAGFIHWPRISGFKNRIVYEKITDACVRKVEVRQIQNKLINRTECLPICIYGEPGSGKSSFYHYVFNNEFIEKMNIELFDISLQGCSGWEDFCFRVFKEMNIVKQIVPEEENWMQFADIITRLCWGYWHCVIVLDHLDRVIKKDINCPDQEPAMDRIAGNPVIETIKYWIDHGIQIVFTCQEHFDVFFNYSWKADELKPEQLYGILCTAAMEETTSEDGALAVIKVYENDIKGMFGKVIFQCAAAYFLGNILKCKCGNYQTEDIIKVIIQRANESSSANGNDMVAWLICDYYIENTFSDENDKELFFKLWGIVAEYPGDIPVEFIVNVFGERGGRIMDKMTEWGLCETIWSGQDELYNKLVNCAKECFGSLLENLGMNDEKNIFSNSSMKINKAYMKYHMPEYCGKLRKDAAKLQSNTIREQPSAQCLLDLLEKLGKNVKDNIHRNAKENRHLNLVLHRNIRGIVRYLNNYLVMDNTENMNINMLNIMNIIGDFSHYFHYMPNYTSTFVDHAVVVLDHMYQNTEDKIQEKNIVYLKAVLYRVRGDIQMRLGKKEDAGKSYVIFQELTNLYAMLEDCSNTQKVQKLGGDAVLIAYNCKKTDREKIRQLEDAAYIFEKHQNTFAQAYCYQKMGELMFSKFSGNNKEYSYEKIMKCYQRASDLFSNFDHKNKDTEHVAEVTAEVTAQAYINKCIGDLTKSACCSYENHSCAYYYMIAFASYCEYINWQGFANVIQAMGTLVCSLAKDNNEMYYKSELLYKAAEDCYRVLGDTQGLADTLDYLGHNFSTRAGIEQKKYGWKALNCWKESRGLWGYLNCQEKVRTAEQNIAALWRKLREDVWI